MEGQDQGRIESGQGIRVIGYQGRRVMNRAVKVGPGREDKGEGRRVRTSTGGSGPGQDGQDQVGWSGPVQDGRKKVGIKGILTIFA